MFASPPLEKVEPKSFAKIIFRNMVQKYVNRFGTTFSQHCLAPPFRNTVWHNLFATLFGSTFSKGGNIIL